MLFRNAGQRERLGPSRDALHGGIQLKFSQRTGNAISHRDCPTDVVKPMLFGCKTASDRHHRPSPRESVQAEILQPIVRTVKTDRSEEHTSELQSHSFISYAVFFFNDTATTEIYTLSLHDALPICDRHHRPSPRESVQAEILQPIVRTVKTD